MRKICFLGLLVFILSGCFSLKTPLPQINYYDLDFEFKTQKQCKKTPNLGISEIRSSSVYEGQEILLRKKTGEIVPLPQIAWVDSPKNLFKKFLIKQFNANCIKTSISPFGGVKNDYLLKIELLNFDVIQKAKGDEFVQIAFFYEISSMKSFKILESGVISEQERAKDYIASFKKAMMRSGDKLTQKIKSLQDK